MIFNSSEIKYIQDKIFTLLDFSYDGVIEVTESDCLTVEGDAKKVQIGCSKKNELARGMMLLAKELNSGVEHVSIRQKANFKTCGVMLDFSRGCVYKVDALKQYLDYMAVLGMNMIMLYLEDTYELDGDPYFGYMRGRYTREEIREIDDYAYSLGIEVIPCIQTLAHLTSYLRWEEASTFKDTDDVLLVGEEKTYDFIRTIIKNFSSLVRSKRIHLGMDEAHSLGKGAYSKKHKEINQKQIFIEHLMRVKSICEQEGLSPIIWSDMIFRVCGGEGGINEEYDPNSVVTEDISKAIEGLNLTYWDYYRVNQEEYDSILERHLKFNADISVAGGIWTWDGYLPNFRYAIDTAFPSLRACIERGIEEVYATSWGANGTDTDYLHSITSLAIYTEFCYRGMSCTEEDVLDIAGFVTKTPAEVITGVSDFFMGYDGAVGMGGRLIDADPLYELVRYPVDYGYTAKVCTKAADVLDTYPQNELACLGAKALRMSAAKCNLFADLRPAYQSGNIDTLKRITFEDVPKIISLATALFNMIEEIAERNRKPFGMEMLQNRFASILCRLDYTEKKLVKYINGEIEDIPELNEKELNDEHATWLPSEGYMRTLCWKAW